MNRTLSSVLDFLLITAAATAVAVGVSSFMPANAQVYGFEVIKYGIADETWEVIEYGIVDMDICLSGDIDEWFEHVN